MSDSVQARREAADRMHSAAIHLLRRVREVDAEAMGISPARAAALSVLVFGGARSLTELAAAERVTSATMSKLVTAMEGEGLLRRYPDVNDARSIRLEATAKGRRILERGRRRRLDLLERLLGDASEGEIRAVHTAASVVERAIQCA
jgi:DNA-binding MarR family transcriptional regulator